MPKIKVLGSLSGMEPTEGHHHTSVAITEGGSTYFFDAGENCSRLAHLGGVDLLNTRAVFISHTHYDHVGGLGGLFWNMRKLAIVKKRTHDFEAVRLYIPELEPWDGILKMLSNTEGGFFVGLKYSIIAEKPKKGLFYEDENIRVYAYPSHHEPDTPSGDCRTFSYRIEFNGFSMVYSGDFGSVDDLAAPIGDGCDLLMSETGHHKVRDVCAFAEGHSVGEILFYHHGREIMNGSPTVKEALGAARIKTTLAYDGIELVR